MAHRTGVSVLCAAGAATVLLASGTDARQEVPLRVTSWGFHISDSPTDALSNSGAPFTGERDLYIWSTCAILPFDRVALDLTGSFEFISFVPDSGVTLVTGLPTVELAFDCRSSWGRLGTLTVRDTSGSGGQVCMGPARGTQHCGNPIPEEHAFEGYTTLGGFPCQSDDNCGVDYVDPLSWGKVKAYFETYGR